MKSLFTHTELENEEAQAQFTTLTDEELEQAVGGWGDYNYGCFPIIPCYPIVPCYPIITPCITPILPCVNYCY